MLQIYIPCDLEISLLNIFTNTKKPVKDIQGNSICNSYFNFFLLLFYHFYIYLHVYTLFVPPPPTTQPLVFVIQKIKITPTSHQQENGLMNSSTSIHFKTLPLWKRIFTHQIVCKLFKIKSKWSTLYTACYHFL
jgi:hypothetical protein